MTDTRMGELRTFARFGVVGIVSNATLFATYLVLTGRGIEPLAAATLMWILGVAISFALNRSWTFRSTGSVAPALARYGLVYGTAYVLNLALLVLVTRAGYPHALVQGVLIVLFAVGLFIVQRSWVFRQGPA
jgi:putative flippase GtrA